MAYGKIDLTAGDIAFLRNRLARAAELIAASMAAVSSPEDPDVLTNERPSIDQ